MSLSISSSDLRAWRIKAPATSPRPRGSSAVAALALLAVAGVACEGEGPAIQARWQSIHFVAAPTPALAQATATVSATASSGLPVRFSSLTPSVCSVDATSGVATATGSGTCTITANQSGDSRWAPAAQAAQDVAFDLCGPIVFSPAPAVELHDRVTVAATRCAGVAVSYSSATPSVCSVDGATGLVTTAAAGACDIVATAGTDQATQTLIVTAPSSVTAPGAPAQVTATAGDARGTATIRIGATRSGGSPITGYAVSSVPSGIVGGATSPIDFTCPSSCAGYRFTVTATSAAGTGPASDQVDVVTTYDVVATVFEPDTQPNDSIFVGSFVLDASTGAVSELRGRLSESMTGGLIGYPGDTMTWLGLDHQLSSLSVTLGGSSGLLVTTFLLDTTRTLSDAPRYGGTDGWSPGTGSGYYAGYPGANPGNAYARIFVNPDDPLAPLSQVQLGALAYADCSPGGMMGKTCMTGTALAGYGTVGTMSGYPVSQITTRHRR